MKKRGRLKAYNTKIVITPSLKEVWIYESPIIYHTDKTSAKGCKHLQDSSRKTFDSMSATGQYDSLKRKQRHYENMRWEVSRLVDCNFDDNTKFLTLTFENNIADVQFANTEFKNFIKRLNYHIYHQKKQALKYIATWEKQRRGSIHYHVIFFAFPYIPKPTLENLWGHGFIKINLIQVDSKENHGRYVSKYFSKDLDLKEHKKKAFFTSQNLKKPIVKKIVLYPEEQRALEQEPVIYMKEYDRQTYVNEAFRIPSQAENSFKSTLVRYYKIKRLQPNKEVDCSG